MPKEAVIRKKVIEIFDHRQLVFLDKFINSKNHIELVGSCATLITEEFIKNNLKPSSAKLNIALPFICNR